MQFYAQCGQILSETAAGIGMPNSSVERVQWKKTMVGLAIADDVSEVNPTKAHEASDLLKLLELDQDDVHLLHAADRLIWANIDSHRTLTIRQHFIARAEEASECINLLKYQDPDYREDQNNHAWQQLDALSVAGIHLDSFFDAKEDVKRLPQFSIQQLSIGALASFINISRDIEPHTKTEVVRAAHRAGLDRRLAGKALRKILLIGY